MAGKDRTGARRARIAARFVVPLALSLVLVGCGGGLGSLLTPPPADTFDLRAPTGLPRAGGGGTLIVTEPSAVRLLDGDRIVVAPRGNEVTYLANAQLADRLPRLVQARLIETFHNASRIRTVARPGEGIDADRNLVTEIRAFEVDASASVARVEITARTVGARSGRVIAGEVFRAEVPSSTETRAAVDALERALQQVLARIVAWASR